MSPRHLPVQVIFDAQWQSNGLKRMGGRGWESGWIYMIMPKRLPFCWIENFSLHTHLSSKRCCISICTNPFLFLAIFIALNARSNFTVKKLQMWQFVILVRYNTCHLTWKLLKYISFVINKTKTENIECKIINPTQSNYQRKFLTLSLN